MDIDDDGDGYSENEGDCDDSDPLLNPVDEDQDGASPCDGDCDDNNNTLNLNDADGDGQSTCDGDCDDGNAVIYQGATELCDGQVNDCADELWGSTRNPQAERDEDGDGYVSCESSQSEWVGAAPVGYGDCDDADPSLNNEDLDADGYSTCTGDCDDADPFVYSGAASNDRQPSACAMKMAMVMEYCRQRLLLFTDPHR